MGRILQAMGIQLAAEPTDGTWSAVGNYEANVQPPARSSREPVSVTRALGLPAAYRAVELSAGMSAQLSIDAVRGSEVLAGRQVPGIVTQPDPWRTLDSWIERQVVNYATEGNNFLRIWRAPDGTIASLEVLDPFVTQVIWRKVRGRMVKRYSTLTRDGRVELGADDVIHSMGLEVAGLDRGLSPIGWCRAALGGVLDVRDYADRWFRDESTDAVLTTDQRLEKGVAREYKRAWYEPDPNDPAGPRLRVLGSGLHYEPIMLKPEDAQWLQAQNFGILDVARMFGVPAAYLEAAVDGTALTYQTLETIDAQFLRTTIFPRYLRKIEAALTQALPRGQRARFRTSDLLRPDAKTRAEIDAIYITNGVYDGQHVRTRDGIAGDAPAPRPAPSTAQNGAPS